MLFWDGRFCPSVRVAPGDGKSTAGRVKRRFGLAKFARAAFSSYLYAINGLVRAVRDKGKAMKRKDFLC